LDGERGPSGPAGPADTSALQQRIEQLASEVDTLRQRTRTIVLRQDGKEIDRETYGINEPYILDVETLTRRK